MPEFDDESGWLAAPGGGKGGGEDTQQTQEKQQQHLYLSLPLSPPLVSLPPHYLPILLSRAVT